MNEYHYLLAWSLYGLGALGGWLVGYQLVRWLPRWLRESILLLLAIVLLTPTAVDPSKPELAPAIAIIALDVFLDAGENALRATAELLTVGLVVFAIYLVLISLRFLIERRNPPAQRVATGLATHGTTRVEPHL